MPSQIKDLMSQRTIKVTSVTMLNEAAALMQKENIGVLPVVDDGKVAGVLTDRDITTRAVARGRIDCSVKEIMTNQVTTIPADATVDQALKLMTQHHVRRLPVVDGNHKLVGMLSLEDLTEAGDERALLQALKAFHQETRHK